MAHVFYRHYRNTTFHQTQGILVEPHGGVTMRLESLNDSPDAAYRRYSVSFALVNNKDLYCKKTGRQIADERHHSFEVEVPADKSITLEEAMQEALMDSDIEFPMKRRLIKKMDSAAMSIVHAQAEDIANMIVAGH